MKAYQRVLAGIVQAPEGRGVFPGMTVQENLDMGHYGRKFDNKADYKQTLDRVFELFPRLEERRTAVRRHAVRRRAADGGDRPGPDGQAGGAAAGRAVDGAGADDDPADLPDHLRDQRQPA